MRIGLVTRVGLVACAKSKCDHEAPARELYVSPLFKKAAAYCEREYDRWYILSALHGLVAPERVLEPYDVTLQIMPPAARTDWAAGVIRQLTGVARRRGTPADTVWYLHAGGLYRRALEQAGLGVVSFETPLVGLGIGQQLAWYNSQLPAKGL